MRMNQKIQGAAVAIALLGIGFTALSAEAKPKHKYRNDYRHHDGRYDARYDYDRYDNDAILRNNGRSRRAVRYYNGSSYASLPSGCRRVVVRQRAYYTPDNRVFFTYNPARNIYIVVNNPFRFF
jgi:hypothetical protein